MTYPMEGGILNDLHSLVIGLLGGIVGSFFKLWIDDLRAWQRNRLSMKEKLLLQIMQFCQGKVRFVQDGVFPPKLFWPHTGQTGEMLFVDQGEISKLISLELIKSEIENHYYLSPTGWAKAKDLPLWKPPPA